MKVVEGKPVPIYEVTCFECGSKIEYLASEVSYCHITCPVCGSSLWANTISPVRKEKVDEWLKNETDTKDEKDTKELRDKYYHYGLEDAWEVAKAYCMASDPAGLKYEYERLQNELTCASLNANQSIQKIL